jgi:hypothetical protein
MDPTVYALAPAALLAVLLARRAPSSRQWAMAWTLALLLGLALALPPLRPWPVLYVVAFCMWYAATARCVWVALSQDEEPEPAIAGAAFIAQLLAPVLAASALAVRFAATMHLERAAFALALAAQLLAVARFIWRARHPDDAQRVALILAASSVVDAMPGPWLLGEPARDWAVGRWIAVATWIIVAGWEVRCLTRARSSRR